MPSKHSDEILEVLTMNRSVHHLSYRNCITTDEFNSEIQNESVTFSFSVVNRKTHEIIDILTAVVTFEGSESTEFHFYFDRRSGRDPRFDAGDAEHAQAFGERGPDVQ